jgi:hypothetical protein
MRRRSTKDIRRVRREPARRWHYTTEVSLSQIVESGAIRLATTGIADGERPAAWTSINAVWEQTANKAYWDEVAGLARWGSKASTASHYGLARIEVRPTAAPHDWVAFRALSGLRPDLAASLARTGRLVGSAPYDWFVAFDPIEATDWIAVEVWRDGRWVPAPGWADAAAGRAS